MDNGTSLEMGRDQCLWPGNSRGDYSASSAYFMMSMEDNTEITQQRIWSHILKLEVNERVRCFVWLMSYGRLLTNHYKHKMHLGYPYCRRCSLQVETISHVMRDCPIARVVWMHIVPHKLRRNFFNTGKDVWIAQNVLYNWENNDGIKWNALWAIACHYLWLWRNKETHDSNVSRPPEAWVWIRKIAKDYKIATTMTEELQKGVRTQIQVKWQVRVMEVQVVEG
ncbi:hypothetical protein L195_g024392 [Trifolium pratense]|uniref:Reverse transcriptase zinc-binding domain-containing protein n=1 Tax=Trifolium pratense TaxID=57577 RepID=A0A2K3NDJ4_TRIPR|nr:hypothetical protein L195_g024392 [Trifolium pratense]